MYPALGPSISTPASGTPSKHFLYKLFRSGTGPRTRDTCGAIRTWYACSSPEHHAPFVHHESCGKLSCPICYRSASSRSAHRAEDRVLGMLDAYRDAGVILGRIRHVEFSVDPTLWTPDLVTSDGATSLWRAFQSAYASCASRAGGCVVLHLWRRKHLDGSTCDHKACSLQHTWVWGPHFHFVGWGFFENSARFHKRTGWAYKTIDDGGYVRSVYKTVSYELTHSALVLNVQRDRLHQSVRYIGMCSNCRGGPIKKTKVFEPVKCTEPGCNCTVHRYGVTEGAGPDYDKDRGPLLRLVPSAHYRLAVLYQRNLSGAPLRPLPAPPPAPPDHRTPGRVVLTSPALDDVPPGIMDNWLWAPLLPQPKKIPPQGERCAVPLGHPSL